MHTGRLSLQTGQHTPGSKVVHLAASGKKREVWNRTLVRVHGNNANIPVIEQRSILCNWYRAHPYPANSSAFHTSCKQHLGLFIERGKGKKTNNVINKKKSRDHVHVLLGCNDYQRSWLHHISPSVQQLLACYVPWQSVEQGSQLRPRILLNVCPFTQDWQYDSSAPSHLPSSSDPTSQNRGHSPAAVLR